MSIVVIIPTYKPADYINECFDSLIEQSCSLESFEVVIVLNGEKDPYYKKIKNYLYESGLQYKLIFTNKKGVSNARNVGIDYAQNKMAEYIIFLDDDDKLSPNFISYCIAKSNPNHVLLSNSKTFKKDEAIYGNDYITISYNKNKNQRYSIFNYRSFFSSACAKMIPLKIIGNTRFDTRYKLGEDSLFCFTISKNIVNAVLLENEAIYYRRIRENSASRRQLSKIYLFQNYSKLIFSYSKVYFSNIRNYNFLFFFSRVVASIIHIYKK